MERTNRDEWEHVGPYRVLDRIGAGGYAEVFAGIDTRTGQRVALKRLRLRHLDDPDSRERFQREGLALEAIDHPNIVRCHGIIVQEGEVWIVMELLKGFTLRQFLRDRGPVAVERALSIAIDVADGLADMHEMAIVHRDLKPENVFLTMPGFQVKVVDLGVAKFHGWSVPATDPGLLVCTPSYAAPELSYGFAVDARSDIYALGLVMYEMLVGKNPFANGDGTMPQGQDALTAHIIRTPPPVSGTRLDVPEGVTSLVARMMDKDPINRPPSMKIVARELRRALRTLRQARVSRGSRPSPMPAAVATAAAMAAMTPALSAATAPSAEETAPPMFAAAPRGTVVLDMGRSNVTEISFHAVAEGAAETPGHAHPISGAGLVMFGTMLIGGACGAVLSVRAWDLPHAPPPSALYALIALGALSGTVGSMLIQPREGSLGFTRTGRPSAWILAIGIAAGLFLGAAATWAFVGAPEPVDAAGHIQGRPS